jgi:integrase
MTDDPVLNVHQFPPPSILSLWTRYFQQSAFRSFPPLSRVILVPDTGRDRGCFKMNLRRTNRLTARQVINAKPGGRSAVMLADGGNLFLQVTAAHGGHIRRSWLFKYERDGKRHEMGLGPLRDVSLVEAREKASHLRKQLLNGVDPLAAKNELAQQRRLEAAKAMTFGECVQAYLATHDPAWKNAKYRQQWRMTLTTYCKTISDLPVAQIDTDLVLRVLSPLWKSKTVMANQLRGRIERVLSWAKGRGLRAGENPARWKGHLDEMLAAPRKLKKVRHHPALPFKELPAFIEELRQRDSLSARALEFTTLTAARTNEAIGARSSEFDLAGKVWTIPAERMKSGHEHRVPLSDRVLEILQQCPGERVFDVGTRTMLTLLNRMRPGTTVHGFRSTFRDWAAERTNFPNHVVEMALAHSIGNAVEASYRRGDLFEKRKRLMAQWADYCGRPARSATVTPMRRIDHA